MNAPISNEVSHATGWFPVLTFLLGFATKFVSDWVQHRWQLERDRETRKETRRDQLSEQRWSFQRQTLLELQEAIQDLARATGAAHHQDEMAFRETGRWQRQVLVDDLSERGSLTSRRVLMLAVRVRDESLRDAVQRFRRLTSQTETSLGRGSTPDAELRNASNAALLDAMPLLEQIHERIGEILRTLNDEESNQP